jgi:hypothetical protein
MGIEDTRTIEEKAQIFEAPTIMQPAREQTSVSKQMNLIEKAAQRRKQEKEQIEKERDVYEQEIRDRLQKQDQELNPDRYAHKKTFQDEIEENTIPGQVVKDRRNIQKDRQHMTPQGMVNFSEEEDDEQE